MNIEKLSVKKANGGENDFFVIKALLNGKHKVQISTAYGRNPLKVFSPNGKEIHLTEEERKEILLLSKECVEGFLLEEANKNRAHLGMAPLDKITYWG